MRRNVGRFPGDFVFQLSGQEFESLKSRSLVRPDGRAALRSRIATLKRGHHARYLPYAFTQPAQALIQCGSVLELARFAPAEAWLRKGVSFTEALGPERITANLPLVRDSGTRAA